MAFPRADCQCALITDAATDTADTPVGLGAILTQVDKDVRFYAISFTSRQLKEHETNYSPFLLEAVGGVWEWIIFTNIYEANNSFSTMTTNHWKTVSFTQQNTEKITINSSGTWRHYSVQKGVQHAD
jgi:hypothetical protein